MKIIFDASALINLINGNILDIVLDLPTHSFYVGPMVYGECNGKYRDKVTEEITRHKVHLLDDSTISGSLFLELVEEFKLGDGETECLAFSIDDDYVICCDDRKARRTCSNKLGADRVSGSLGILREAVQNQMLSADGAINIYLAMKSAGGFLPEIDRTYFQRK